MRCSALWRLSSPYSARALMIATSTPPGLRKARAWRTWSQSRPRSKGGFIITARSEEHTSELQSLMRISYAVFCLKKKNNDTNATIITQHHIDTKNQSKEIQHNSVTKYTRH